MDEDMMYYDNDLASAASDTGEEEDDFEDNARELIEMYGMDPSALAGFKPPSKAELKTVRDMQKKTSHRSLLFPDMKGKTPEQQEQSRIAMKQFEALETALAAELGERIVERFLIECDKRDVPVPRKDRNKMKDNINEQLYNLIGKPMFDAIKGSKKLTHVEHLY